MFKIYILILILTSISAKSLHPPRVIGGSPAEQGQFPFSVSLQWAEYQYHLCGAAIINELFLITAGHCIASRTSNPSSMNAYVGSVDLDQGGTYYNISRIAVHPDYDPIWGTDDIGIVKLADPIKYGEYIQSIDLPINVTVNPGDEATAIGWGTSGSGDKDNTNHLQFLTRKIVDSEQCSSELDYNIRGGQICFGGDEDHGLCYGDSGSPLVYTSNDKNYVIGVVSWGKPCAYGYPDVFARITYYLPWIHEQMN